MQLFIQQASDFYSVIRARVKKFRTQTPCVRIRGAVRAGARAPVCGRHVHGKNFYPHRRNDGSIVDHLYALTVDRTVPVTRPTRSDVAHPPKRATFRASYVIKRVLDPRAAARVSKISAILG